MSVSAASEGAVAAVTAPAHPTIKDIPPIAGRRGMLPVAAVFAATNDGGIGFKGQLPWNLKTDMKFFRHITSATRDAGKQNAVIMGRSTWRSIPKRFRPLARRLNVVLSRSDPAKVRTEDGIPDDVPVFSSLTEAVRCLSLASAQAESAAASSADESDSSSSKSPPEGSASDGASAASGAKSVPLPPTAGFSGRVPQPIETIHITGGSAAYTEAIKSEICDQVLVTKVKRSKTSGSAAGAATGSESIECDTFVPWPLSPEAYHVANLGSGGAFSGSESDFDYSFHCYVHKDAALSGLPTAASSGAGADAPSTAAGAGAGADAAGGEEASSGGSGLAVVRSPIPSAHVLGMAGRHEEYQYLEVVRDIIESGVRRGDRTGTGTYSKFGVQMRYDLRGGKFPLLTTKRVFWRGVAEELLWFLSGDTSAKTLQAKNIHIWDGNASREFLDKRGLGHREEGDLGPVYGFQWRHFGAEYEDMHSDYAGKGVDQVKQVIEQIRTNPNSRRILLSAWNPAALPDMALPPCHIMCQFFVANGELSCQMYQRSADMGLGVPFNIASYALLTRLIAQVCGLRPGDFVHVIGDAHVYSNHVGPLRGQLKREPRPFPTLAIDPSIADIDAFRYEHFKVEGYAPHKKIAMDMAV